MKHRFSHPTSWIGGLLLAASVLALPGSAEAQTCARTLNADVVALDQVFFWNRLGAVQPQGMLFALRRDVVATNGSATLSAGNVQLRADKRPRPLVLRMNVGDCLRIQFQNLLASTRVDQEQPATRDASIHVVGMQLATSIADDGSFVGDNASSLVAPGGSAVYTLYAEREGEHLLYSAGTTTGGQGDGGQINSGLFGAIVVEPQGAFWYRSQVSKEDLGYATTGTTATTGHPIINYDAVYPAGHGRAGLPVLKILHNNEIIHSDLTAIIAGSSANGGGLFPYNRFPANAMYPRRDHPFREFVTIYHDETGAVQAFPQFEQAGLEHTLHSGRDGFHQLRLGRRGRGGVREPPRRGADVELPGVQVRGVLPDLLGGGRPRDGGGRARQLAVHDLPVARRHQLHAGPGPQGHQGVLSGRPFERLPQLPAGPHAVPGAACGLQGAPYPSPPRPPVALHAGRRRVELPGQPGPGAGLGLHRRDRLRRQRQPEPDLRRLDLPLPLLPALRPGHVGALAGPRRIREGD